MKIPCKYQDIKIGSSATVRTNRFLCNRSDEPLKVSGRPTVPISFELKKFGCQRNTIRTLGQAFPISTQIWISKVDIVWEGSISRPHDAATRPDAVQHFIIYQRSVRMWKRVIAKTVRMLGQAIQTYTCYGKNCAILEGGHRRPSGRGNLSSGH